MTTPTPAQDLGFTQCVIDSSPTLASVSLDGITGPAEWYNGHQWQPVKPSAALYSNAANGQLLVSLGASMATVDNNMQPGIWPLLSGAKGFYVEFSIAHSNLNSDHWSGVWVMPREHNLALEDTYPDIDATPNYERWMELDVDESGFTPLPLPGQSPPPLKTGAKGVVLAWEGVYTAGAPQNGYTNQQSTPYWYGPTLDRTKLITFAATFEPDLLRVTWYVNGVWQYEALPPSVPEIALRQNFYLIVTANSHGANVPYGVRVARVRAFVPPV